MLDILSTYGPLLLIGPYPNGPIGGLALTLVLSILGVSLAFPLSIVLALARVSPYKALRIPATVVVYLVRGVPLIMLVFWSYFLVPVVVGRPLSAFTTLVVTLVVYQAAYMSEIVRAGIGALPKGQVEAARSLGLSYTKAMRTVILPQALFNMLPALLSQFIATIKETSIGYVISVQELTFAAGQVNSSLLTMPFEVYFILSVIYFIVCYSLTKIVQFIERRLVDRRSRSTRTEAYEIYDQVQQS
ncbi:polar amino acid ABC transporter inner membrane subunit [Burkholderia lata]|uniref:Polar amino acid ABC transporter inner membrane subunit n=1 Tax=Burkholderia lata (strain ATCC 17760 / DSM 23089 / LMG 22485 / NCIMB 9086 / R18194 / 383) TaxID=482957 RepID=A0A6P2UHG1_BURL3|nr:amino acid ABC transporter permease [Burkholderia lata]VWC76328.1 polar amino acid ABC transporter inner membrane subunit [Burkholderia lata]